MLHNLKETLLSTEMVVDNEYLSQYCDLILRNVHRKREKFKTQKHHIIPKSFYDIMGTPIDNSSENVVNLIYFLIFIINRKKDQIITLALDEISNMK